MHFYDIKSYGKMIRDNLRTDAYAQALRKCVKPDSVVLDIGTGVGILALLACQFGARKVYAIDPNDVIQIAREMAAANGCADRIEFIQDMSTKLTLPEQADIVVYDMHGVLPLFEQNLVSIIDARKRLLAPGGTMIPYKETLWAAVVEAPESYIETASPWIDNPYGLDLRPAARIATNMWGRREGRVRPEQFLVDPKCWATLDYRTLESANVVAETKWTAGRTGTGHGLLVWFDALLLDGVVLSNYPAAPELIFGNAFFPWPDPVPISIGDEISVTLGANQVGDYIWRWETIVLDQGRADKVKAEFKQSNFFGMTVSARRLHKWASDHVPDLNEDGEIERFVLSLMDGEHSVERIASQTVTQFPSHFKNRDDALTLVADLSEKYSV